MLQCVVNVSEGADAGLIDRLAVAAGRSLLDVHSDAHHNRSVLTLAGTPDALESDVRALSRIAVEILDLGTHQGVHPRIGVVDVVPWVDLDDRYSPATARSLEARGRFATWAARELDLPCFLYGPERSLPDIRRGAWRDLRPDRGPKRPHPSAGACAVGARGVLVAYNLWLATGALEAARAAARAVRTGNLRTLGLLVGGRAQVSCNLVAPQRFGPAQAFAAVAAVAAVEEAELVGLLPEDVLAAIPRTRWATLGLSPDRTIEARLPG